jgi:hypothetical protein
VRATASRSVWGGYTTPNDTVSERASDHTRMCTCYTSERARERAREAHRHRAGRRQAEGRWQPLPYALHRTALRRAVPALHSMCRLIITITITRLQLTTVCVHTMLPCRHRHGNVVVHHPLW